MHRLALQGKARRSPHPNLRSVSRIALPNRSQHQSNGPASSGEAKHDLSFWSARCLSRNQDHPESNRESRASCVPPIEAPDKCPADRFQEILARK